LFLYSLYTSLLQLSTVNPNQMVTKLCFNGTHGCFERRGGVKADAVKRRRHVVLVKAAKEPTLRFGRTRRNVHGILFEQNWIVLDTLLGLFEGFTRGVRVILNQNVRGFAVRCWRFGPVEKEVQN